MNTQDTHPPLTLGERIAFGVYATLLTIIFAAIGLVTALFFLWAAGLALAQPVVTFMIGAISGGLIAVRHIRKAWEGE